MKKATISNIILILVLISIQISFSGEQTPKRRGKKAIQFDIDGVSLINGSIHGIAGKYWCTDNLATRVGLNFGIKAYTDDFSDETDREVVSIDTKFFLGIEKYFKLKNKISPYIGGEIGVRLDDQYENKNTLNEIKRLQRDIFIGLLFGVEYWFNKNISLSGCHKIELHHSYSKYRDNIKTYKSPLIELNSSANCLVLSIYL